MRIICFEGPSAVGKTSIASAISVATGAGVIPEVSLLFERPVAEPPDWYLERQVDRWVMALNEARIHPLVILDGDPFQPLWYNWAYDFRERQGLASMKAFYRQRIASGVLSFPDCYIIFKATTEALSQRKEADFGRRRGGFEAHLRLIEPQLRYFRAMQSFAPESIHFVEARTIEESVQIVTELGCSSIAQPLALFDFLVEWLHSHRAA